MKIDILLASFIILVATSCNQNSTHPKLKLTDSTEGANNIIIDKDTIDITAVQDQDDTPIQSVPKHDLTDKDLYVDYDGGNQLADYFFIELIDKETFDSNKSLAVNKLKIDTTAFQKENGVLKLPCTKSEISFVDNLSDGDNHKEYSYIGEIKDLNVYVLMGIYWEHWNYFLVNKTNGNTEQAFSNIPYLSADNKHIISIDVDNFEGITYIDLYEVTNGGHIDPIIGMYIKKWIPINTSESMYWGNDNFLYIPVIHNQDYWAANGNYYGLDQYIRLKPLG